MQLHDRQRSRARQAVLDYCLDWGDFGLDLDWTLDWTLLWTGLGLDFGLDSD